MEIDGIQEGFSRFSLSPAKRQKKLKRLEIVIIQ